MSETRLPPGGDEERVRAVLTRYEGLTAEGAIAGDEATPILAVDHQSIR